VEEAGERLVFPEETTSTGSLKIHRPAMSSTELRTPLQATPNPAFSYAQAAKGRANGTAASATQASQTTSGISTPVKETNSAVNTPSASVNGAAPGSDLGEKVVNGSYDAVAKQDPLGVGLESESKSSILNNSSSSPGSPSFGTASTATLPKEEDLTILGTIQSDLAWERNTPASTAEKSAEISEGRRKKSKKQKNADKEAEKEKEKEKEVEKRQEILVAAPPPAVNIWQQRKEAQALKAKPSPSIAPSSQAFIETLVSIENVKLADAKRRGKGILVDEGDKTLGTLQNGGSKESSNKAQKKSADGAPKGKEDTPIKRAGARGSRISEKEEKAVVNQLPPPVGDGLSWPTPETALEEEKRKAQEREKSEKEKEERDETASNKPRPKEKWVTVPFVPSVNFSTPLPSRGGRGRGGARAGRDISGRGANGEKPNNGSSTAVSPAGDAENRGRGAATASRAASLPPNANKRPSSDTRHQGKTPAISNVEKPKSSQADNAAKNESSFNAEARRASTTVHGDQNLDSYQSQHLSRDDSKASKTDQPPYSLVDSNVRSNVDRRNDQSKEGTSISKDNAQARERADGRADRGRGGFRGRGGHSTFSNGQQHPQQAFTNGHGPQQPNGYAVRQSSNPYSPPIPQTSFGSQYTQTPARGGRGGSRSQSIPNNAMYGRFPPGTGPPQMAPLQTPSPYEFQPMQPMSAVPYQSYVEQYSVLAMVTMQLEYYFSIDNLCKDVFLRKHMDSQGFVFLTFIAGFKRIQALTQEFEMLRYACQESDTIEIIKGEDGIDRLRRKEGWEKWVLAIEERDESVRNDGPSFHQHHQPHRSQMGQMIMPGAQAMSPPAFSPNGTESGFRLYGNGVSATPGLNGNGGAYHPETPLSAAVPDFAPGLLPLNSVPGPMDMETTFFDEDVANLKLVFTSPKGNSGVPYHNASSRTFSNGSIDVRSIAEEIHDDSRPGRGLTNGSRASET
jgi:la-related protein 1